MTHIHLSPLNYSGILGLLNAAANEPKDAPKRYEEVTKYVCLACRCEHDYRYEAERCCADFWHINDCDPLAACPVCNTFHTDHRAASDCCLWRDLDAPTRWAIADRVEAGSTWAEELGIVPMGYLS